MLNTNKNIIWALVELDILAEHITTKGNQHWLAGKSPQLFSIGMDMIDMYIEYLQIWWRLFPASHVGGGLKVPACWGPEVPSVGVVATWIPISKERIFRIRPILQWQDGCHFQHKNNQPKVLFQGPQGVQQIPHIQLSRFHKTNRSDTSTNLLGAHPLPSIRIIHLIIFGLLCHSMVGRSGIPKTPTNNHSNSKHFYICVHVFKYSTYIYNTIN